MTDIYPVKVVFRKFPEGDIIALFPEEPGTNDPYTCDSFQHVGQHGTADPGIVNTTKPAQPAEYAELLAELISIGYRPIVCHKITPAMHMVRKQKLDRFYQG